jgi:hypothetical protein
VGELEAEFQRLGPGNVAAFTAEPVVGATTGCVTAVSGYLETAFACGLAIYPMDGTVEGKHGDQICIAHPMSRRPPTCTIVERLGDAVDDAIAGLPKSS